VSNSDSVRIVVPGAGEVSGLFMRPGHAHALVVLAHGAGAGMAHPFLERLADELQSVGVATLRYQFPYMEHKRRVPDPPKALAATVVSAVRCAAGLAPDLPRFAGGKSMGGRMTSQAAAAQPLDGVLGLVFFGFPLHPPGRPGTTRADHLARTALPMLFLQGTRDQFAELELLRPICDRLGAGVTLQTIEGADHSFHVLKRSGQNDADVLRGLAQAVAAWTSKVAGGYATS
jgi:uncharacterized protein